MKDFVLREPLLFAALVIALSLMFFVSCESVAVKYFESQKPATTTTTPQQ